MKTLLKMTISYNPDKPYVSLAIGQDGIDTLELERRYAGWYATLDTTDSDGTTHTLTPYSWTRYRNTYILEYQTDTQHYTAKIKETVDTPKLVVVVTGQSI